MKGSRALLAAVAIVLSSVGLTGQAAASHAVTVTLDKFRVTSHWKQSRYTGRVNFTLVVNGTGTIIVSVRPTFPGPATASESFTITKSGRYAKAIKLPILPKPGQYVLHAGVRGGKLAERTFAVPDPSEGVVDTSGIATTEGGAAVKTVSHATTFWVTFHFLGLPPFAKQAQIVWRDPSFLVVSHTTVPVSETVGGSYDRGKAFSKGKWYAQLVVAGKVTKTVEVIVH